MAKENTVSEGVKAPEQKGVNLAPLVSHTVEVLNRQPLTGEVMELINSWRKVLGVISNKSESTTDM